MKYKIQIPTLYGWCDLRSSITDENGIATPYEVCLYDTIEEAIEESNEMNKACEDMGSRVVPETELETDNIYEDAP